MRLLRTCFAIRIPVIALALLASTMSRGTDQHGTVISGGTVVDGSGGVPFRADVRILGDRIIAIGRVTPAAGDRIIDARGLMVAPGFIDTHSHADGGIFDDAGAETQVRQGITTAVVGQDGSSNFPLADWFHKLDEHPAALNFASFAGHGTARSRIMGADYKRAATTAEIAKMRSIVEQEMDAGALGLSSGLEYDPGFYSSTEELIGCARGASKHGGIYISHVRDEGNDALKAFSELIRIGREAHLPAQISHIKLDTQPVWGGSVDALRLAEAARRSGVDISQDVYPYLYWQSTIGALIPSRDWDNRELWVKGLADVGGAEHVRLTSFSGDASWVGRTIADIAQQTGMDPIKVIQRVVHEAHDPGKSGSESVVVTAMTDRDLDAFIADPYTMFCSDGGLHGSHPRGAGAFPRVLAVYVRERHVLTLPLAIHKMTDLAAHRMGLTDRGRIERGMKADIVLFDAATVRDTAVVGTPQAPPEGIPYVFVNGVAVVEQGRATGERPGRALRRTGTLHHRLNP